MRPLLLTLLLLTGPHALAATVYKWVDEKGVTHYSDQPHPGAERLEIESPSTYSAPPPPATAVRTPAARADEPAASYRLCEIARPAPDEVFTNTSSVDARVRIEPEVRAGHRVILALDGRRLPNPLEGEALTLAPVFRGTHTLMVLVEDARGQALCQSQSVTFHVRQPSVRAPNPANRPRF